MLVLKLRHHLNQDHFNNNHRPQGVLLVIERRAKEGSSWRQRWTRKEVDDIARQVHSSSYRYWCGHKYSADFLGLTPCQLECRAYDELERKKANISNHREN
jgi:hypothetical protein